MNTEPLLLGELARLERALARAAHPLSGCRPAGRSVDDLRQTWRQLRDGEMPLELQLLWEWWGGSSQEWWAGVPAADQPGPFGRQLPSGVEILSLEEAIAQFEQWTLDEIVDETQMSWLPIAYEGDMVSFFWCELDNAEGGAVPISLCPLGENGPASVIRRFESMASWIAFMAHLLESDVWVHSEQLDWHCAGDTNLWSIDHS